MKNSMISYNIVYGCIRDYYLQNFPHPARPLFQEMLQILLNRYDIEGTLSSTQNSFTLNVHNPRQIVKDCVFENDNHQARLEAYLSSTDGMGYVVEDIVKLYNWLVRYGFIDENGIATEKMFSKAEI